MENHLPEVARPLAINLVDAVRYQLREDLIRIRNYHQNTQITKEQKFCYKRRRLKNTEVPQKSWTRITRPQKFVKKQQVHQKSWSHFPRHRKSWTRFPRHWSPWAVLQGNGSLTRILRFTGGPAGVLPIGSEIHHQSPSIPVRMIWQSLRRKTSTLGFCLQLGTPLLSLPRNVVNCPKARERIKWCKMHFCSLVADILFVSQFKIQFWSREVVSSLSSWFWLERTSGSVPAKISPVPVQSSFSQNHSKSDSSHLSSAHLNSVSVFVLGHRGHLWQKFCHKICIFNEHIWNLRSVCPLYNCDPWPPYNL